MRTEGTSAAMALMTGTYTKQIDRKGRVGVPAPLRNLLLAEGATGFHVRPVVDRPTLEAMTTAELESIHSLIDEEFPIGSAEREAALDQYVSAAREVTPDAEGRVVLPPEIRDHLGPAEELTFVGRGGTVQIWEAETYRAYMEEQRRTAKPVILPPRRRAP